MTSTIAVFFCSNLEVLIDVDFVTSVVTETRIYSILERRLTTEYLVGIWVESEDQPSNIKGSMAAMR